MSLMLSTPMFGPEQAIPRTYTCEGQDISPELHWSGIPDGTQSLVLIVDDPDAPDPRAPKMTWVHWVLYNLPPASSGLPENISESRLPPGTLEGVNDWKHPGYRGPCPPIGKHRYFFKLYALDTILPDLHMPTKDKVLQVIQGHVVMEASYMGTYQKHR